MLRIFVFFTAIAVAMPTLAQQPGNRGIEDAVPRRENKESVRSGADDDDGRLPSKDETKKLFELTPIDQIRLDATPGARPAPTDRSDIVDSRRVGDLRELRMEQGWTSTTVRWCPTNFSHRPLYFEDVLLERHGQSRGAVMQPLWSAAHFFGTFPMLPYKMGLDRPLDCVYTLGYGRPGNCKPSLKRRFVWEADAAALESSAWIAAVLLLP